MLEFSIYAHRQYLDEHAPVPNTTQWIDEQTVRVIHPNGDVALEAKEIDPGWFRVCTDTRYCTMGIEELEIVEPNTVTSTEFTKNEAFIAALGLVDYLVDRVHYSDAGSITALENVVDVLVKKVQPASTAAAMSALHKLMEIYTNAN